MSTFGQAGAQIACEFTRTFREKLKAIKNPYPPDDPQATVFARALEEAAAATPESSNLVPRSAALTALERVRGFCATVIEDHSKDTYSLRDGVLPQAVAVGWASELRGLDVVDYLNEAISDEAPAAAPVSA